MQCPECKGLLSKSAIKCRCGWLASVTVAAREHIQCCFAGCATSALVRVWTKTGFANVCTGHYGSIEIAYKRNDSPHLEALRKAYENSPHYARLHGRKPLSAEELALRAAADAEMARVREAMKRQDAALADMVEP
jgi:hypothetical protein